MHVRRFWPLGHVVLSILALAISPLALAQGGPPAPPQVTVAKPLVKNIVEEDEFIGRFEAVSEVQIRARVTGYLDKIHFRDGAMVKEGDLLFTIDQRPYRATLEEAAATLASAKARLPFAEIDLTRGEELLKRKDIPEQIVDQRRQLVQTTRAEIDRAEATLRRAKLDMEFTEIRAPISGRISRKLVTEGNLINANDTILTNIVSLDPIHFYFDVDERSYLAYTRMAVEGTRPSSRDAPNEVRVQLSTEREPMHVGHMDFVDNRLDASTGTMRGRAVFENKDLLLAPGLFGRLTISGSGLYKGVLLPDEAITTDQDRRIVYVVGSDNKVSVKTVRPGPRIDGYRVIRAGLTGDETVVVNGLMRVRPGIQVTPKAIELPPKREQELR